MYGLCSINDFRLCDFVQLSVVWHYNDISEIECFVLGQSISISFRLNKGVCIVENEVMSSVLFLKVPGFKRLSKIGKVKCELCVKENWPGWNADLGP